MNDFLVLQSRLNVVLNLQPFFTYLAHDIKNNRSWNFICLHYKKMEAAFLIKFISTRFLLVLFKVIPHTRIFYLLNPILCHLF